MEVAQNQGVPLKGKACRVIFLRHGETDWNDSGRYQGHLDIPLNERGRRQAQLAAEALKSFELDAVYSSDLVRAMEVAEVVSSACHISVVPERGLRERNMGVYQGLTHREILLRPDVKPGDDHRTFLEIPCGESAPIFLTRAVETVEGLAAKHPGGRILLVTHGGFIHYFVRHALGLPVTAPVRLKIANTSLHLLDRDDEGWAVVALGITEHLGVAAGAMAEKA